jgi:hypothetical protein
MTMTAMEPRLPGEAHALALEITQLKYKAGMLGLWKTMHALEPATQAIGYEMAEILEGKRPDHMYPKIKEV